MGIARNYWHILQEGIAALDEIAAEIIAAVDRNVASPEQVLTLRDVAGLSARLAETTPEYWRDIWTMSPFTGQDLGVLAELIEEYEAPSPYRDDPDASGRQSRAQRLRGLHNFLDAWDSSEYDAALRADILHNPNSDAARPDRDQQQN